jgi:hypothetical protein
LKAASGMSGSTPAQQTSPGPLAWGFVLERVTGIEPAL